MSEPEKTPRGWKVALVLMPALLLVATVGAVAWKIRVESRSQPDPRLALVSSAVNAEELRESYGKLADMVGVRDWETVEGRTAMRRAMAFIAGTLSPQNYGFEVQRGGALAFADELWPTLWVDLPGGRQPQSVVVVATPYDRGNLGVGALLAIANDLRDDDLAVTVRLVFYPATLLGKEPKVGFLVGENETVREVLCVNRFSGAGETLWIADEQGELEWDMAPEPGGAGGVTRRSSPGEASPETTGIAGAEEVAGLLAGELRVFELLQVPVIVCRGSSTAEEEPRLPFSGGDAPETVNELLWDRYVARTVQLRNLIRERAREEAKRP